MYRPKKKKDPSLLEELKELEMLEEGEMVDIPELENEDLIEENLMSVVVRCLNPAAHKVGGLVKALPPIWGLEDRVHGRGVGADRVQFIFQSDRDLHHVLTRGPWFVNGWIVSMDQWTPNPGPDFLCKIPFWIRIRGIPIHLLKKQTVESLVGPLGKIEKVELHARNSTSVEYVRALVWIDADAPLQFRRIARFKSGEVVPTELEYEKLLKICFTCKKLTHDQDRCPDQPFNPAPPMIRVPRGREALKSGSDFRKDIIQGSSSRSATTAARSLRSQVVPVEKPSRSNDQRRKEDNKGKKIAAATSQVWKKKEPASTPKRSSGGNSKSSRESTVPLTQNTSSSGNRLSADKIKDATSSGASQELVSVFERLGQKDNSTSKEAGTSEKSQEGRSSKGSRSPPSVFERLGSLSTSSSGKKRRISELYTSKRRRTSTSGEREGKKARLETREINISPPSIFQRLGSQGRGSDGKDSGDKTHSAHVAAKDPNHSVQRIVLGSGKIVEEGRRYIEGLVEKFRYHNLKTVEPLGRSGGLAVMWKESCTMEILQANRRVIDLRVKWQDKSFFLSCVYGDPVKSKRSEVWERLTRIGICRNDPWMMTGDFNELVDPSEKLGGADRNESEGKDFRQMLSACGLGNIRHTGYQFSWAGTRNNETVQCRLDRTVANQAWIDMFPQASAHYLRKICSDHSPVLTTLVDQIWKRKAGFKYDQRWIKREGFAETVKGAWIGQYQGQLGLVSRIASCRKSISSWKRLAKPNSALRIQELQYKIDEETKKHFANGEELHRLKKELNEEYYKTSNPLNATLGSRPSYAWRSMMAAQNLIRKGAKVVIGNGRNTNVWGERWLGSKPALSPNSTKVLQPLYRQIVSPSMTVADLMSVPGSEWNTELIQNIFPDCIKDQILSTHIQGRYGEDSYSWEFTKTGHYTVKSGYWVQQNVVKPDRKQELVDQPSLDVLFQQIWKLNTSPKIHHFLWKSLSDSLPAAANMRTRHIARDGSCGRCSMDNETVNHILFTCPYARLVWAVSPIHAPPNGELSDSLYANLFRQSTSQMESPTSKLDKMQLRWSLE
ncbi:hypothetical protein Bca52824_034296 [Brassica carinata]|uniref:Reverse transcriptase zinc-binding domain-containing protein n=1 Tax=Brassica carinata TaxID=52824 RepID=A0A8X7V0Q3_BRACI|nr:hypothetical protein Bca52824_034296 [Brassica carinata]